MYLILLFMFAVLFAAKVFGFNEYTWFNVFSPLIIILVITVISALFFDKDGK